MNDNLLCLLTSVPIPLMMIIIGIWLWKNPPAPGNCGYMSAYSRASTDAWYFAQVTWGRICVISNIPTLIVTSILFTIGIILKFSKNQSAVLYIAVTAAQIIIISAGIFITEHKLHKSFNRDGTRKSPVKFSQK